MPNRQELRKLSDEHKSMLARKCVSLLMGSRINSKDTPPVVSSSHLSETAPGGHSDVSSTGRGRLDSVERRPRAGSRGHRSILAAPPICVPEVQEQTHAKR